MKKILSYLIRIILSLLAITSIVILSYYVFKLNIIPNKYMNMFYIGYSLIIIVSLLFIINLFIKNRLIVKIISSMCLILISGGLLFIIPYFKTTDKFLKSTQVEFEGLNYSVVVLKHGDYKKIEDLKNLDIAYKDDDYKEDIKKEITSKIKYTEILSNDLSDLYKKLSDKEVDAIIIEDGYLTLAKEEIENFEENTKIIYTFKLKIKAHKEDTKVDISKPFIVYISGIDQWGSKVSDRGRSDVNQIMVINPKTHHILIVNTPRDYYVQLAGTTGLRDKLTHAGIYGVEKSIATLENLYDIDINNYIRINFDSLVKIVDLIGGIDIESDITFKSFHIKGWVVPEGMNHFNGKQALAYSRERYAYKDGDHHRGRNQQQVMEAIINKLTTSDEVMKNYNSILNSLEGTFKTDIPTGTITAFIKYQLDEMPKWNVESVQAYGFSSWGHTYSMPSYLLWVMEPDWSSIRTIKAKINEVLKEEVITNE